MSKPAALALIVLCVAGCVLFFGLRAAQDGRDLHAARRLSELDRALMTACAGSAEHVRALLAEHRRRGAGSLRLPIELHVGESDGEIVVHAQAPGIDAARIALRGSPDPDQLVPLDEDRLAWLVAGWDVRGAVAVASVDDVLAATLDGHAAGFWTRTTSGMGRPLPAPFPPLLLTLSEDARAAVEAEAAREYRRLLVPPVFLALLTLAAGALIGLGLRREARAEQRRRTFLSAVTHELKTPIANITLYAETLRDHAEADPERVPEFTGVILSEANRLRARVQQMLDVATGDGSDPTRGGAFFVGAAVSRVVVPLQEQGAEIRTAAPEAPVWARGPAPLFERALEEVLQNAEKFAPGSAVVVGWSETGSSVEVTIDDEGPGIPRAEREQVFEAFTRLGDDMTNTAPGTGLGLALVRQCMEDCGGSASIEVGPTGVGARVRLTLPAASEAAGA